MVSQVRGDTKTVHVNVQLREGPSECHVVLGIVYRSIEKICRYCLIFTLCSFYTVQESIVQETGDSYLLLRRIPKELISDVCIVKVAIPIVIYCT